jgi:CubicO group peptidase (beta-lactamase class C family)
MSFRLFIMIGIVSFLCCCCNSDETEAPDYEIEFLIVNEITGLPVKGAQIKLLEEGRTVKTAKNGIAGFTQKDLEGASIQAITDSVAFAFSIIHPDFRPREINASLGIKTIALLPDSTGTYTYQKPVQFDDGLAVGTLLDAGFDTSHIQNLMKKIATPGYRDLHSILIYKDGKLVLEEYYYGNHDTINFEGGVIRDKRPAPIWWTRNEKHYIASVNKALTSTLTGIVLDQHEISTDAYLKDYLPEYATYFEGSANKSNVTFHHALNMTLGFQWDEWGSNDLTLLWKSGDFADFLLNRNNNGPGTTWYYNSASPNVILKALENIVDEPIRSWAHENFYGKLGITDYTWQYQPDGYPEGAARMYLRPRDMLKIGITYLDEGKWKGEQVIPEAWVEKCMQVQQNTSSGKYSHFFWIRTLNEITYLSADGDGGNYINIFPDQNMVVVITQGNYLQWPLYVNQANNMMGNYIFPALE